MAELPIVIREARESDAAELSAMHLVLALDGRGMVLSPDQIADAGAEQARLAQPGTDLIELVARRGGQLAGHASLRVLRPAYCRHVGLLALGVHPEHQRRGVGRALMEALIERARSIGLRRLELNVRADNDRARALYRSLGFEEEGRRRDFVLLPDGGFVDDLVMVRWLPDSDGPTDGAD
ncbi:MAG: GNAT family N-acetyltransferase [Sandaracinaceae bacterium]|nr:GNAT family N-acetyltransferase [Sandaracinaceae bacterium]